MGKLKEPVYSPSARILAHAPMITDMIKDVLSVLEKRPNGPMPSPEEYLQSIQYTNAAYLEAADKAKKLGRDMPLVLANFVSFDVTTGAELATALNDGLAALKDALLYISDDNPVYPESFDSRLLGVIWTAELCINRGQFVMRDERVARTHVEIDINPVDMRLLGLIAYQRTQSYQFEAFPDISGDTLTAVMKKIAQQSDLGLPKGLGKETRRVAADFIDHVASSENQDRSLTCAVGHDAINVHPETNEYGDFGDDPYIAMEYMTSGSIYLSVGSIANRLESFFGPHIDFISGREIHLGMKVPSTVMQNMIGKPLQSVVDHPIFKGLPITIRNSIETEEGMNLLFGPIRHKPIEIKDVISSIANGYNLTSINMSTDDFINNDAQNYDLDDDDDGDFTGGTVGFRTGTTMISDPFLRKEKAYA